MEIKKGKYYYCFKTVKMNGNGIQVYTKGQVYHSDYDGHLTDDKGDENHSITADYADTHFVEVDAVIAAYAKGIRARANNREAV